MKYYTESYLKNLAESTKRSSTESFSQIIMDSHKKTSYDIFLSHSFSDKKLIEGLYFELTSKGNSVYVDWIVDSHLDRKNITKETVERIRKRMKQCKSLIYAISENASSSKWMTWELGFMDGYVEKCAILPVTIYEDDSFDGHDFLSVYPVIATEEVNGFYRTEKKINLYENKNKALLSSLNEWKIDNQSNFNY
jgi:hypothetical protein